MTPAPLSSDQVRDFLLRAVDHDVVEDAGDTAYSIVFDNYANFF
jgi:hypothetical protein